MHRTLPLSWTALITATVLLLMTFNTTIADDGRPEDLIGKSAPDLSGEFAINGKAVDMSALKGKVVLLDFWAVWCAPCRASFPHLRDWHKEYKGKGLEIVGVTSYFGVSGIDRESGGPEAGGEKATIEQENAMLRDFATYHKLDYRIQTLAHPDWKKLAVGDYHLNSIPSVVLIDRKGVVRLIRAGAGEDNVKAIEEEIKKLIEEK